ncbi:hypothetical protein Tco_1387896, partial [Tanacetum coccineum]
MQGFFKHLLLVFLVKNVAAGLFKSIAGVSSKPSATMSSLPPNGPADDAPITQPIWAFQCYDAWTSQLQKAHIGSMLQRFLVSYFSSISSSQCLSSLGKPQAIISEEEAAAKDGHGAEARSSFPKVQETFARISGYCEQNDIHSPTITIHESLIFSAFLRLPKEVSPEEKM